MSTFPLPAVCAQGVSLSTASSRDVQGVSISTSSSMCAGYIPFHRQHYGRAACILCTASCMDVQGISHSTASSMDMQGISLSTACSMDVQSVVFPPPAYGCRRVYPFPPPAVLSAGFIPFHLQQYCMDVQGISLSTASSMDVHSVFFPLPAMDVAGYILFHRQQYGCAGCIPLPAVCVQGVSFLPPAVWTCRVYQFQPPPVWTCRVYPFHLSTVSSVDVQGLSQFPVHRWQCGRGGCM